MAFLAYVNYLSMQSVAFAAEDVEWTEWYSKTSLAIIGYCLDDIVVMLVVPTSTKLRHSLADSLNTELSRVDRIAFFSLPL